MLKVKQPADKGKALQGFLKWAIHDGQKDAAKLNYAPLPETLVDLADKKIESGQRALTRRGSSLMSVTRDVPSPTAPGRRGASPGARSESFGDLIFKAACLVMALSVPVTVALMLVFLVWQSLPTLRADGASFLFDTWWDPDKHQFGAVPFIVGTILTSVIAMVVAVPLGVGAAAFLAEIATGWVRRVSTFLIELLAAIPSVVFGFWGVFVLVPLFQKLYPLMGLPNTSGRGIFTCGILLAVMIVPYLTAITYDVCRAVPTAQRQGALALGTTRWQMIWTVILPYARPGIIGGCFLALGLRPRRDDGRGHAHRQ